MAARSALIIDDEQDVTTYYSAVLSDHGWRVRTANSGDEGLALAQEEAPDVILLDVMMPGRGGLSTLIALRKAATLQHVKVVLITGIQKTLTADYRGFLDRFKHYHPDGYVEKPIDPQQLIQLVDELASARTPAA